MKHRRISPRDNWNGSSFDACSRAAGECGLGLTPEEIAGRSRFLHERGCAFETTGCDCKPVLEIHRANETVVNVGLLIAR
jgi:hypothetical protein